MIARVTRRLRALLLRRRLDREMQAEMAEHLHRSTERLIARGLSPDDARREARREFGNVLFLEEEGRIARGTSGVDALLADVRFAIRHFARHPLSTLTMITVLSVGIAINVVLYTLLHSASDRPPSAVPALADMVRIRGSQLKDGSRIERSATWEEVEGYASLTSQFSSVAAWTSQPVTAAAPGIDDATVTATFVTDNYFDVLGVSALRGRDIAAGDAAQVAVLSHAVWTRSFAQDPAILGRTVTLADVTFTVIGVTAPRFRGAAWEARDDMQVWVPLGAQRRVFPGTPAAVAQFSVIGRLQPGTTHAAATAAAKVVAARRPSVAVAGADTALAQRDPSVEVVPLLADNLEPGAEANLRLVAVAFTALGLLTLLVTCANVGALQTGLALARRREIAIRLSLGAHRTRVIRQLVTESIVLALVAGLGAVGVTVGILRFLLRIVGSFSFELAFDSTAIAVAFGTALLAGLLFGLSPALHATRLAVAGALRDSTRATPGGRGRLQRGLVVAQVALTQPLAVCVATMVYIGIDEYRRNPANPNGEQIVQVRLTSAGARGMTGDAAPDDTLAVARDRAQTDQLVAALRTLPGVTHAAFVPSRAPINLSAYALPRGSRTPTPNGSETFYITGRSAMPGYLDLVGTPVVLGRDLQVNDSARVRSRAIPVVIGDDMARQVWGASSPIGARIERVVGGNDVPLSLEVVGVFREEVAARGHVRNPFTVIVPPDPQLPTTASSRLLMLRVSSPMGVMAPLIRATVREQAPGAALMELRTLAAQEAEERLILWGAIGLFSAASLAVLVLCALGLYAVVAFAVGQRTGEIAVRMAVGARARQIVTQFAADGLRLTTIGVVVGLPLSLVGLRQVVALSPDLPDVSVAWVTVVIAIAVMTVAGLASWLPATRAADVDPAVILRKE